MKIHRHLSELFSFLDGQIADILQNDAPNYIKEFLQIGVEEFVYREYAPSDYERLGEDGGLKDKRNMKHQYSVQKTLGRNVHQIKVRSIRTDFAETIFGIEKRDVAMIVETGVGYLWVSDDDMEERPFHEKTQTMMAENDEELFILQLGLERRGIATFRLK